MARPECIGIRQTLTTLLPKVEIERPAQECVAVRRRRKIEASVMLWTVLLGFGSGRERTLAGLRRTYERVTGKSLVPSSFYDRFSTALIRMFRAVLRELMRKLAASEVRYADVLEGLCDMLVADAPVVKAHRLLARRFPGTRKNSRPAAAKLHLVMSASGTGANKTKVSGERANDHRTLQMGPWVEGSLLLFDLGYFRNKLFDAIDRIGGYFVIRLATSADPRIVATHRQWRGRAIELEGKRLGEVAARLKRDVLDVKFEVAFKRRAYGGSRRTARRRLHLVAARLPESKRLSVLPHQHQHRVARRTRRRSDLRSTLANRAPLQGVEASLPARGVADSQTSHRRYPDAGRRHRIARQSPVVPCRGGAIVTHLLHNARAEPGCDLSRHRTRNNRRRSAAAEGAKGDSTTSRIHAAPRGTGPESVPATAHRTRRMWRRMDMTPCNSIR